MKGDPEAYMGELQTEVLGNETVRELVRALDSMTAGATHQAAVAEEVSVTDQTISEEGYLSLIAEYGGLTPIPKATSDDSVVWRRREGMLDWWTDLMKRPVSPPESERFVISYLDWRKVEGKAIDGRELHLLDTVAKYARIGQPHAEFDRFGRVDPVDEGVSPRNTEAYYAYRIDGRIEGAWLSPGPEERDDDTDDGAVLEEAVELALLDEVRLAHTDMTLGSGSAPSALDLMSKVVGGVEYEHLQRHGGEVEVDGTSPAEVDGGNPATIPELVLDASVDADEAVIGFEARLINSG